MSEVASAVSTLRYFHGQAMFVYCQYQYQHQEGKLNNAELWGGTTSGYDPSAGWGGDWADGGKLIAKERFQHAFDYIIKHSPNGRPLTQADFDAVEVKDLLAQGFLATDTENFYLLPEWVLPFCDPSLPVCKCDYDGLCEKQTFDEFLKANIGSLGAYGHKVGVFVTSGN